VPGQSFSISAGRIPLRSTKVGAELNPNSWLKDKSRAKGVKLAQAFRREICGALKTA
jgi:hypothetical protein